MIACSFLLGASVCDLILCIDFMQGRFGQELPKELLGSLQRLLGGKSGAGKRILLEYDNPTIGLQLVLLFCDLCLS